MSRLLFGRRTRYDPKDFKVVETVGGEHNFLHAVLTGAVEQYRRFDLAMRRAFVERLSAEDIQGLTKLLSKVALVVVTEQGIEVRRTPDKGSEFRVFLYLDEVTKHYSAMHVDGFYNWMNVRKESVPEPLGAVAVQAPLAAVATPVDVTKPLAALVAVPVDVDADPPTTPTQTRRPKGLIQYQHKNPNFKGPLPAATRRRLQRIRLRVTSSANTDDDDAYGEQQVALLKAYQGVPDIYSINNFMSMLFNRAEQNKTIKKPTYLLILEEAKKKYSLPKQVQFIEQYQQLQLQRLYG